MWKYRQPINESMDLDLWFPRTQNASTDVCNYTGLFKMIAGVWPPRFPDATPCDFFLWGYVKDQVYVPPHPAKYLGTEGTNQNRH
jgi:hypothetical protein